MTHKTISTTLLSKSPEKRVILLDIEYPPSILLPPSRLFQIRQLSPLIYLNININIATIHLLYPYFTNIYTISSVKGEHFNHSQSINPIIYSYFNYL